MEIEEAKKLIEAEKTQRQEVCEREIMTVLEKHNCIIVIELKLNGTQIVPTPKIVAK